MSFDALPDTRRKSRTTRRFLLQNAELTVCLVKMSDAQLDQFIDRLLDQSQVPNAQYPATRFAALEAKCETPEEA